MTTSNPLHAHGVRPAQVLALALAMAAFALRVLAAEPMAEVDAKRLDALISGESERIERTLGEIRAAKDARYTAALIELLRADQIGIVTRIDRAELVRALEAASGQSHGEDWPAWVRWYAGTELKPPEGFTGWKGKLLGRIDPTFARLLPYGIPRRIRVEEIVWGGVGFEGIPALDRAPTVDPAAATYLRPDEPVFGVALNGEARAYPLRILDWHEMANDVLGGVSFSLAYCTLCGSGIAFDGRVPDGKTYDFGSSGFLYRSNKLMVDRQTQTLWNQFTGRPVVGPLVDAPEFRLKILPSVVTSWAEWRRRHPHTSVLSIQTGFERPYEPGAAYADYFASDGTMFPILRRNLALPQKARVFGLEIDGLPKAYTLEHLRSRRVLNDSVGATELVIVAGAKGLTVNGKSVRSGLERTYDAGGPVRAYRRGAQNFKPGASADELLDGEGGRWAITESALVGPDGRTLERIPGVQGFWFAWSSYHPRTALVGAP